MIRVIIANDQEKVANMWQRVINKQDDMECPDVAYDGEQAIDLAMSHQPNVMLMDVMMPGIDGIEATQQILAHNDNIKVIVYSGRPDIAQEAFEAGAVKFLSLPLLPDILLNTIREVAE